ncbi:hypothetical protein [Actinopolymorpha sp. B9G3]|uniref:barstar family protein n=1 Tax=Actinopolymorpha sp. B9G3 TaxID=3158970 RepID=UPI0032D97874
MTPIAQPFTIHLGVNDALQARFEEQAHSRGMSLIRLDLAGLSDLASLVDYLSKAFMFPHEVAGLDAATDLISDLEWFGSASGYLVAARGLAESSVVAESFVSILPNVVDRWRSQAVPFVVTIDAKGDQLQRALLAANREMERAGRLPWAQPGTGPVDVIDHTVEPGTDG